MPAQAEDGATALDRRRIRRWIGGLRAAHPDEPALALVAGVVDAVAAASGLAPVRSGHRRTELAPDLRPEPAWCSPALPGLVYEGLAPGGERRARGAWFTPAPVVDALVALALADGPPPGHVLDPACGGGAFLLGVADALVAAGVPPSEVPARLAGVDLDPGAVAVARWSLELWAAGHGTTAAGAGLVVGDALSVEVGTAELVVGNPPFASPLRAERAGDPAARYREGRPHLGPYADAAACFLDRAAGLVAPGGRLVLVLPQSLLAGRDGAGLRQRLAAGWRLRALWITATPVFDASVHVFAPVLERLDQGGPAASTAPRGPAPGAARQRSISGAGPEGVGIELRSGPGVEPAGWAPAGASWADAAASGLGVPPFVPAAGAATLTSIATATSGFRDEHYGLVAACQEAADAPDGDPVVTVGQIDPLRWLRDGPIRFGGRRWRAPVVDRRRLEPGLAAWVERQRRPKVLLATQTRILEPLIDRTGHLVPTTPVIAVHADAADLDRVAAVLLAPPVAAWAVRRALGTALQPQAIKLSARQVLEVPLPGDHERWAAAAALLAGVDAHRPAGDDLLWEVAGAMCDAYGVEVEPLRTWWWERRPDRSAGRSGRHR